MDHEIDRVLGLAGRVEVAVAAVESFDRDLDVGKEDWTGEGRETWLVWGRDEERLLASGQVK
jgi:hypothetical protein